MMGDTVFAPKLQGAKIGFKHFFCEANKSGWKRVKEGLVQALLRE